MIDLREKKFLESNSGPNFILKNKQDNTYLTSKDLTFSPNIKDAIKISYREFRTLMYSIFHSSFSYKDLNLILVDHGMSKALPLDDIAMSAQKFLADHNIIANLYYYTDCPDEYYLNLPDGCKSSLCLDLEKYLVSLYKLKEFVDYYAGDYVTGYDLCFYSTRKPKKTPVETYGFMYKNGAMKNNIIDVAYYKEGYDFDGSFSVKTFSDTEWEIYRKNGRTVKFESTNEKAFDPEKEYLRTIDRYNAARAGKDVPGMTRGDQIDYLLSTWNYSDEEYDAVWAEFQKRCPNWLKRPRKENIEYIEKEIDMIDLREKKVDEKFDGDDIFDYIENNGKSFKNDDAIADAITNKFNVSVSVAKKAVKAFHNGEVLGDDDLKESCAKTEAEDEIKFVNKGEKFKSEKGDDVEIIAVDKKDDKTEVTYKLGDEEKKGDIKDVIKMLNGAEYKAVDDKKDEKKSCESEEDDAEETPDEKTPDEEEPAEEKKTKKESVEDDSVEVTLTEDFHVPGTDIILEKGDVIRIIPRKDD